VRNARIRKPIWTAAAALATAGIFAVPVIGMADQGSDAAQAQPAVVAEAAAPDAATAPEAPTLEQLHPLGVTAQQQTFTPSAEQLANAKAIVETGKAMGLPPRAWVIAVATSLQESNLKNIGHLGASNDHDSLGLFQQRPSSGWGTPEQIQDPTYSATAFYNGLVEVPGWDTLPLTQAAQKVQVSAYPDHYAKHEAQAGDMIAAVVNS
jgi:hypothetical protein